MINLKLKIKNLCIFFNLLSDAAEYLVFNLLFYKDLTKYKRMPKAVKILQNFLAASCG